MGAHERKEERERAYDVNRWTPRRGGKLRSRQNDRTTREGPPPRPRR
jgi:hypothetical protein